MINSKTITCESGSFNPFVLAAAAIAICAVLVGAAAVLAPASATSDKSADGSATYAIPANGPTGYFPDQFVNQAKEIEPLPPTF